MTRDGLPTEQSASVAEIMARLKEALARVGREV